MVLAFTPVGQNKFAVGHKMATPYRPAHQSLVVRAHKNDEFKPSQAPKAAAKNILKTAAIISEKDLESLQKKAQEVVDAFKLDNLDEYRAKSKDLTEKLSEVIKDERVREGAASYFENGVNAHVDAIEIAKEVINTAENVASGKASIGEGASSFVDKLFKFQKLGFQTSGNMIKTTLNLLLGKKNNTEAEAVDNDKKG